METDQRKFLTAAALGAGGLAAIAGVGRSEASTPGKASDKGKPGEGGAAYDSLQLPPGARVAYNNSDDIGAMPDCHYSIDGSAPKNTSGGWNNWVHASPNCLLANNFNGVIVRRQIDLHGDLARMLSFAAATKKPGIPGGEAGLSAAIGSQVSVVAGACNHLDLLTAVVSVDTSWRSQICDAEPLSK